MILVQSSEQIGAAVRQARQEQGLRQPDLAAACGTSVRFIVEIERGKPTAQIGKVLHVLHLLGLRLTLGPASLP